MELLSGNDRYKMNINLKDLNICESLYGNMIFPRNDMVVGRSLPLYGEWSEGENIVMSQLVNNGDSVIDIGANIGTTAISLSRSVGESGKVFAFEPQQIISQCLSANVLLNNIKNIEVYTLAVSSKSGWVYLDTDELSTKGRYGSVSVADKGHLVKSINLNEFKIKECSFIKIDVEGHEWEVIQGAESFLNSHKPVVYFEAKKELTSTRECIKWFMGNGWDCYWHFAFWYRKNNWKKRQDNIFGGTGDMNILAVPRTKIQPDNFPKLQSENELWDGDLYLKFYSDKQIPLV